MPRHGDACSACQRAFDVGETFQAFLFEAADGYERRDFCVACGPGGESAPGAAPGQVSVGSWRTRRSAPTAKKVPTFDREALFAIFSQLDPDDASRAQFRFVLALLLWRKKALKFIDTTSEPDGREVWQFAVPKAEQTFDVVRPDLDEAEVERLSGQLEQLMAGQPVDAEIAAALPASGQTHD